MGRVKAATRCCAAAFACATSVAIAASPAAADAAVVRAAAPALDAGANAPRCVAAPFVFPGEAGGPAPRALPRAKHPEDGARGAALRATGTLHLLVILAEFADRPHRIAASRFAPHLFGGPPSLGDYYDEASGGLLAVTGTVFGWVTLPGTQLAYSNGTGGTGAYPTNAQKMAEDAVRASLDSGLDLGSFDATGDGIVDALLVVHSGQGLEWSGNASATPEPDGEAINSHQWAVRQSTFLGQSVRIRGYFTGPELQLVRPVVAPAWTDSIATIGVFCHELGHMLGLPDLYDTETGANRVGVWDLMDYGSWNPLASAAMPPGAMPSHFSLWSKMFLGWEAPEALAPAAGESIVRSLTLESASEGGAGAQFLANAGGVDWRGAERGTGEYFLAEVRTRAGYDAGLPDEGVLIYHVDESRRSNDAAQNPDGGNLLELAAQDVVLGLTPSDLRGDPWPGAQSTFGPASMPSSIFHSGAGSGVTLDAIAPASAGTFTLEATVTNTGFAAQLPFARPNPWHAASSGAVDLVILAKGGAVPSGTRIVLHDLAGRVLRVLGSSDFDSARRVARWDGRTASGTRASTGVIFFRVEEPGAPARTGRFVLLR